MDYKKCGWSKYTGTDPFSAVSNNAIAAAEHQSLCLQQSAMILSTGFIPGAAEMIWAILSKQIDAISVQKNRLPNHLNSLYIIRTFFRPWLKNFEAGELLHDLFYRNFSRLPNDEDERLKKIYKSFFRTIVLINELDKYV